jgi:plastocyanin
MKPEARDRFLLPLLLPIGILAAIALILWAFSRILLGVHGTPATVVAMTVAFAVLVISALAVARPQVRASTLAAVVGATAGVAMLAGGIAVAVVAGEEEGEEPDGDGAVVELAAANLAFDPQLLTVPAGEPFTIAFDNRDGGIQHNASIFDNPEFSGTPLFEGEIVTGPIQTEYAVEIGRASCRERV